MFDEVGNKSEDEAMTSENHDPNRPKAVRDGA